MVATTAAGHAASTAGARASTGACPTASARACPRSRRVLATPRLPRVCPACFVPRRASPGGARAAAAKDEVEVRVDLVGVVDGEADPGARGGVERSSGIPTRAAVLREVSTEGDAKGGDDNIRSLLTARLAFVSLDTASCCFKTGAGWPNLSSRQTNRAPCAH
jgi:hypothetical protein